MTVPVDLRNLEARTGLQVSLARNTYVVSDGETDAYSGFDVADRVTIDVDVLAVSGDSGQELVVTVEGSADGESWEAVGGPWTFTRDGSESVSVDAPAGYLRAVWTVGGGLRSAVVSVRVIAGSIQAPGGGSGGSTPVQQVTVEVSSEQILALMDEDVVLIPGTPGFVTLVLAPVMFVYLAGSTPYQDNGGTINIISRYAGLPGSWQGWVGDVGLTGVWDQDSDQFLILPSNGDLGGGPTSWLDGVDVVLSLLSNGEGQSSPTLGDGTMKVPVAYLLAPTS